MKIKLILAIVALVPLANTVAMPEKINRSISSSENGINDTMKRELSFENVNDWSRIRGEMRAFLWDHWLNKRQGHLLVTSYTKEGDVKKSVYTIQPDKSGDWRILVSEKMTFEAMLPKPRVETRQYQSYRLERVLRRTHSPAKSTAGLRGDSYQLKMIGRDGRTLGQW